MDKKEKGFTLIEIIVVICILSILFAIVGAGFPKYRRFMNKMQLKAESETVLHTILNARAEAIMDGEVRRVYAFYSTDRVYITKPNDSTYATTRIELPSNIK